MFLNLKAHTRKTLDRILTIYMITISLYCIYVIEIEFLVFQNTTHTHTQRTKVLLYFYFVYILIEKGILLTLIYSF